MKLPYNEDKKEKRLEIMIVVFYIIVGILFFILVQ